MLEEELRSVGYIVLDVARTSNWINLGMTTLFTSMAGFAMVYPGGLLVLPTEFFAQETSGRRVVSYFSAGSVTSLKLRCFGIVTVAIALAAGMWIWSVLHKSMVLR